MKDDRIHTLKEINLDAARYRWLRENAVDFIRLFDFNSPKDVDGLIDNCIEMELSRD